jgi:hypothetical protein
MDQTESQPQSQTQPQNQTSEPIRVNPLQILVNAAIIGYQRGAFSMKETSIISQSIDFFVETKQAVLPQPQTQPQSSQSATPVSNLETIKEEKGSEKEFENEKVIFPSQ